jgi:hypothetical protein
VLTVAPPTREAGRRSSAYNGYKVLQGFGRKPKVKQVKQPKVVRDALERMFTEGARDGRLRYSAETARAKLKSMQDAGELPAGKLPTVKYITQKFSSYFAQAKKASSQTK